MKLTEYLNDKISFLMGFLLTAIVSGGILKLIGTRMVFIVMIEIVFSAGFTVVLIMDFTKRSRFYQFVQSLLNSLDEKTLLSEMLKRPDFVEGQILCNILHICNKAMNDKIAAGEQQRREYREYIELWVHEIKTPITSVNLMIENNMNPETLRIADETRKIERYVEQALYYARSTASEKDFQVERINLQEPVRDVVKSFAKEIVSVNGHVDFEGLDQYVYADKKTIRFVLSQIVENSIKYRKQKVPLKLSFEGNQGQNRVCLKIQDNGIGIEEKDLRCVFDKGFTGKNGREYPQSTGIGLYLCNQLCSKMNMGISVKSIYGTGTTVYLLFPLRNLLE